MRQMKERDVFFEFKGRTQLLICKLNLRICKLVKMRKKKKREVPMWEDWICKFNFILHGFKTNHSISKFTTQRSVFAISCIESSLVRITDLVGYMFANPSFFKLEALMEGYRVSFHFTLSIFSHFLPMRYVRQRDEIS